MTAVSTANRCAGFVTVVAAVLIAASLVGWLGKNRTRSTARIAVGWYGLAAALMLLRRPARDVWTAGAVTFLVHVAVAFHDYFGWSHERAVEHTRQVAGWGGGVFVSYLFTLVWAGDALWWWLSPASHERRPRWLTVGLHAFLAFIVFNGTVVYESGAIRWVGLVMFGTLAALLGWRLASGQAKLGGGPKGPLA